ncbi:MAG: phosphatidate cytidylyltransferase [Desulfobacterales bacterium]
MHLKRWITSIVALPLLVLLIYRGGPVLFAVFIGVVTIPAIWEYLHIVSPGTGKPWAKNPILLLSFVTGPVIVWAAYHHHPQVILGVFGLTLILSVLLSLPQFKSTPSVVDTVFKQMLLITYIPVFLSYLVVIRSDASGVSWTFFLLCIVFAGDTGAYYAGTYWGRHKLCPAVSPKKTWEGAIGGLAVNIGVGSVFKVFFLPELPWGYGLLLFVVVGIAGQIGDLFESQLKRVGNIKDSGTLLPGHGGLLDRIDALLFAAPVVYYYKMLLLSG